MFAIRYLTEGDRGLWLSFDRFLTENAIESISKSNSSCVKCVFDNKYGYRTLTYQ